MRTCGRCDLRTVGLLDGRPSQLRGLCGLADDGICGLLDYWAADLPQLPDFADFRTMKLCRLLDHRTAGFLNFGDFRTMKLWGLLDCRNLDFGTYQLLVATTPLPRPTSGLPDLPTSRTFGLSDSPREGLKK